MTKEELQELFNKVEYAVWDYDTDYYARYTCGNEKWYYNGDDVSSVSFEVEGFSSKTGMSWTEYWSIDSDGKIYTEDKTYNDFEDFLKDWE